MARMYPATYAESTNSQAEERLYHEFKLQLPASWVVMHGVKWLNRKRQKDFQGEADFVIVHPQRGVLILEVKGGRIEGEWSADNWTSTDRFGDTHSIKNPVTQARSALHDLKKKLDDAPVTQPFTYPIYCGIAVPDVLVGKQTYGLDWQRDLVIDSSDLPNLTFAIERMFSPEKPPEPLSKAAIDAVVGLLQPTVELTRLGLVAEMKDGERKMLELSTYQSWVLLALRMQRRAVIDGCAGSGKTMLAVEKAIQLAEEGFSVLLTCFNKSLSAWIQGVVDQQPAAIRERIRVSHYHDLAVKLCEEAGRPSTVNPLDQNYWNDTLPDDLMDALPTLTTRFDAIVVDEGQDIRDNWWITIEALLANQTDGLLFIFQDPHQSIYRRNIDLPIATPPFPLPHNYRSTAAIHEHVISFYPGDPKPLSIGPAGRPVEFVDTSSDTTIEAVRKVLARLVGEERLFPSQIVVLTPLGQKKTALLEGTKVGTLTLTWESNPGPQQIRVSTIHAFKGLESDVVVLAEADRLARIPGNKQLSYVALSRAKHHLVVIGQLPPGFVEEP